MQYRPYGKQGYEVSAFGVGCMRYPRIRPDSPEVDLDKTYEMIRYAVDHGVNYFDTAYGYHGTNSETILGQALAGGYREKVKIATKQPINVMNTQSDIRRNLENTLKKLQTDCIDVYLIHNINADTWDEIKRRKIYEEFEKFRSEGMIQAIGFSYHGKLPVFREVLAEYPWAMCQVQQNLIDVDKEVTEESIALAGEKGCALVIMEPLRGGGLATPPAPVRKIYDEYPEKRSGVEWSFRHLLNYTEVSTILSGVTTLEQLKENIEIFSKPDAGAGCLNAGESAILRRAKEAYEAIVTIPCTACEYCMPCPAGVGIPTVFSRYNEGMMFESFDQPRRSYSFLKNAGGDASHCVECGACEPKCPQRIPIIESLKTAHATLDGWIE